MVFDDRVKGKMIPYYKGPYTVKGKLGPNVYSLEGPGGKIVEKINIRRLIPYVEKQNTEVEVELADPPKSQQTNRPVGEVPARPQIENLMQGAAHQPLYLPQMWNPYMVPMHPVVRVDGGLFAPVAAAPRGGAREESHNPTKFNGYGGT